MRILLSYYMRLSISKTKEICSIFYLFLIKNYFFGLAIFRDSISRFYRFLFFHYYFLDISDIIHLKIGQKSHETQCNGSKLIFLFTCPTQ